MRYDVIDAVLSADASRVNDVVKRANVMMEAVGGEGFKGVVEAFNRVNNLAQKAVTKEVDPSLFETDAERGLWRAYTEINASVAGLIADGQWTEALARMTGFKQPIDAFFDQVMVMVEDEKVKNNRLAMLAAITSLIFSFADFSKIVFA